VFAQLDKQCIYIKNKKVIKMANYVISDTHFGSEKVIRVHNRPFIDSKAMDYFMVTRWNEIVNERDTVYFIGDFGNKEMMDKLNGNIIYIRGNNDDFGIHYMSLKYKHEKFYMVHIPNHVPKNWNKYKSWLLHGHLHNDNISKYPFINGMQRTINTSVEMIGYKPISLDYILSLNYEYIKYMNYSDSKIIWKSASDIEFGRNESEMLRNQKNSD